MEIKSGDLEGDIRDIVLEIVDTLPEKLRTNETASNIWCVLIKHIEILNMDVLHTTEEIEHIKDLENYTENKVHHSLVKELMKNPVLYERLEVDGQFFQTPHIRRRFTLPILKAK